MYLLKAITTIGVNFGYWKLTPKNTLYSHCIVFKKRDATRLFRQREIKAAVKLITHGIWTAELEEVEEQMILVWP